MVPNDYHSSILQYLQALTVLNKNPDHHFQTSLIPMLTFVNGQGQQKGIHRDNFHRNYIPDIQGVLHTRQPADHNQYVYHLKIKPSHFSYDRVQQPMNCFLPGSELESYSINSLSY